MKMESSSSMLATSRSHQWATFSPVSTLITTVLLVSSSELAMASWPATRDRSTLGKWAIRGVPTDQPSRSFQYLGAGWKASMFAGRVVGPRLMRQPVFELVSSFM